MAPPKKFEAKFLVRNALRNVNFYGAEKMVRINQIPKGLEDLDYIVEKYPFTHGEKQNLKLWLGDLAMWGIPSLLQWWTAHLEWRRNRHRDLGRTE